jgi:YD repeat-containing protein
MRLTAVTDGVSTSTFAYNGDGDRVSQTVDGTLATYVLDAATPLTMVLGTRQRRVPPRRRARFCQQDGMAWNRKEPFRRA